MLKVPEIEGLALTFVSWRDAAPAWSTVPEEFHDYHANKFCKLIQHAFFNGAKRSGHGFTIDKTNFKPREGVDGKKAISVLWALMQSFDPKHEVKISTCGYMLDQWFEET